jgi:putative membrane protein
MALEKSSTDQMHALAQRMVDDHTRMQDELASITGRGGADQAPLAMPADKAQQLRNHLAPLQGDAFRNAFVDVTIRNYHLAIALFADEAKNGRDKALRAFARKELPALREHLAMAQAMLDAATPSTSQSGA